MELQKKIEFSLDVLENMKIQNKKLEALAEGHEDKEECQELLRSVEALNNRLPDMDDILDSFNKDADKAFEMYEGTQTILDCIDVMIKHLNKKTK